MKRLLICLLILVGCGSQGEKNELKISFNTHPATMDPRKAADFVSSTLVCMIYEGLTRCSPEGGVEPALAERTDISLDGKVYTFHLRKAYWSDGKPITAKDFELSWKQILDPPGACAFLFYPIKNAELCTKGKSSVEKVGIRALDDKTLCVELERPTPYFYSLSAFPSFLPVPSHAPDQTTIYSGPFQIERIVQNSEIALKKNPVYWNEKNISLDAIHISIVADEMTALQMFERGDLDWLGGSLSPLPLDAVEKLQDQIQFIPSAASTLCTFNTRTFPFHNSNLRKAFSYSIDRKEIVQQISQVGQIPATSILPPSFSSQTLPLFDPYAARLYLEKGLSELHITKKELESICLYSKSNQLDKRLAQILQKQWKDILGITIQLEQLDFKSHAQKLQAKDYQIALASWIAQFEDPVSILDRFKDSANLKNYSGWENSEYVRILNEASTSRARKELLEKAENLLADHMPLTPIYHWSLPTICGPRIQKTATSPCGGILFERFETCKK